MLRPQKSGRRPIHRFLYENGLSLVLLFMFLGCWIGQIFVGQRQYNESQRQHGQPQASLIEYLKTGHFIEATTENWESEWLQMAAFIWLTSFLVQKGSPESKAPDESDESAPVTPDSPWPVHRGGWILKLYEHSLTLTFLLLFFVSFFLHAWGGVYEYNQDQVEHGQSTISLGQYMGTSRFWFESLQNWQSEFLSIAFMVVLSVFLRQKGSPESKPVEKPHWENE